MRPPHSLPRQRVARACEKNRLSVDTLLLWSALSAGRRPKYKKKSGEPDEFDEEQADVVAVATPQEARPLVTAHASKDGALQEVCNEKNRHTPAAS